VRALYERFRTVLARYQKRFIRWYADYHMRRGTPGRVYRVPFRGYRMWLPISWGKTVAQRRFGAFEPWTFGALDRSVRAGATVIEIGACYGEFTLYLSKLVGPSGRVYAFELVPQNFEILTRNIALNHCENVEAFHMGIAARGVSSIQMAPDPGHLYESISSISGRPYPDRHLPRPEATVDVPCVSLLDFMAAHSRKADYLFMDIEACEVALFQDIEETIRSGAWHPIVYMETHPQFYKPGDLDYLRRVLIESGYAIEAIGTHWLCRPPKAHAAAPAQASPQTLGATP
jgi:FkbM family methyltransferase